MFAGEVGILNVGAGDTKLSFDPSKPEEAKRAAEIVEEMLRRGYAILVAAGEKDGKPVFHRAEAFDPNTCEYIVAGTPDQITHPEAKEHPKLRRSRRRGTKVFTVPAASTRSVAVARTAGG